MDGEWLYSCPVAREDDSEALFALPAQGTTLLAEHPKVVATARRRIEGVVNQPLEGLRFNEVCDPAPAHFIRWLSAGGGNW